MRDYFLSSCTMGHFLFSVLSKNGSINVDQLTRRYALYSVCLSACPSVMSVYLSFLLPVCLSVRCLFAAFLLSVCRCLLFRQSTNIPVCLLAVCVCISVRVCVIPKKRCQRRQQTFRAHRRKENYNSSNWPVYHVITVTLVHKN